MDYECAECHELFTLRLHEDPREVCPDCERGQHTCSQCGNKAIELDDDGQCFRCEPLIFPKRRDL